METIGDRLRKVREAIRQERGMRQLGGRPWVAEIEEVAGYNISSPTATAYESEEGTEKIPGEYLAAVCQTFNINPAWLLLGDPHEMRLRPPGEAQQRLRLVRVALEADDVAALARLLEGLDPGD